MGLNPLLGMAMKFLGGAGASSQPANIKRTEAEQKPATALEQVNAAVITPPEQLRATANSISQAITPEIIQNPEAPLAINQQKTSPGFQVTISQETMNNLQPMLLKAVNGLKVILPFIEAGIKTILPKSEVDEIFSNIIKNNGGREKAMQWLETHVKNNPVLARANAQAPTSNPV